MGAIDVAATGLKVMKDIVHTVADNISKKQAIGFKKVMMQATDLPYNTVSSPGTIANAEATEKPSGIQYGHGAKVSSTHRILQNGELKRTENPLHVAIMGAGYFGVTLSNNRIGYTRAGAFQINKDRAVTTLTGELLADGITVPDEIPVSTVEISEDGIITGIANGNTTERVEIGRLTLNTFNNEDGLIAIGNGMFLETAASGEANNTAATEGGSGKLIHKSLEMSNVDLMSEMVDLMDAHQISDALSRVMTAANEMEETLIKGK